MRTVVSSCAARFITCQMKPSHGSLGLNAASLLQAQSLDVLSLNPMTRLEFWLRNEDVMGLARPKRRLETCAPVLNCCVVVNHIDHVTVFYSELSKMTFKKE